MAKTKIKVLCENIFKNNDKEELKKIFIDKWVSIIKLLEQKPHHT